MNFDIYTRKQKVRFFASNYRLVSTDCSPMIGRPWCTCIRTDVRRCLVLSIASRSRGRSDGSVRRVIRDERRCNYVNRPDRCLKENIRCMSIVRRTHRKQASEQKRSERGAYSMSEHEARACRKRLPTCKRIEDHRLVWSLRPTRGNRSRRRDPMVLVHVAGYFDG